MPRAWRINGPVPGSHRAVVGRKPGVTLAEGVRCGGPTPGPRRESNTRWRRSAGSPAQAAGERGQSGVLTRAETEPGMHIMSLIHFAQNSFAQCIRGLCSHGTNSWEVSPPHPAHWEHGIVLLPLDVFGCPRSRQGVGKDCVILPRGVLLARDEQHLAWWASKPGYRPCAPSSTG
jgi:hypothetical protein